MTPSFARRILLILAASASLLVAFGDDAHAATGSDGQVCSDWTNPDGTTGTNCPKSGHRLPTVTLKRGMTRNIE